VTSVPGRTTRDACRGPAGASRSISPFSQYRRFGSGVDEAVELDLAHRAVAADREADRRPDDAGLGERGVDHALFTEVLLQAVGDAEDAAELADVLSHDDDLVVVLQGAAQAKGDGFTQRGGHRWLPSNEAW
jgi:hypothetical protein